MRFEQVVGLVIMLACLAGLVYFLFMDKGDDE